MLREQTLPQNSSNVTEEMECHDEEENQSAMVTFEDLNEKTAVTGLLAMRATTSSTANTSDHKSDKGTKVTSGNFGVKFVNSITSDSDLRSLTNINSLEMLNKLSHLISKHYPQKVVKLDVNEKIVLVFLKLKFVFVIQDFVFSF